MKQNQDEYSNPRVGRAGLGVGRSSCVQKEVMRHITLHSTAKALELLLHLSPTSKVVSKVWLDVPAKQGEKGRATA